MPRLHDVWGRSWPAAVAAAVVLLTVVMLLVVGSSPLQVAVFGAGALALALVFAQQEAISVSQALDDGRRLATQDPATDLPSSDYADHFVASEFAAAQRGRTVTVVLFGFDEIDAFTATHGAAAADHAVREFGRILKRLTRKMNQSARYGWRPDAFLSVLSESDTAASTVYVQRVQAALAEVTRATPMPTVSVGITAFQPDFATPAEFVGAAERALAEARADGGGCIRYWSGAVTRGKTAAVRFGPRSRGRSGFRVEAGRGRGTTPSSPTADGDSAGRETPRARRWPA